MFQRPKQAHFLSSHNSKLTDSFHEVAHLFILLKPIKPKANTSSNVINAKTHIRQSRPGVLTARFNRSNPQNSTHRLLLVSHYSTTITTERVFFCSLTNSYIANEIDRRLSHRNVIDTRFRYKTLAKKKQWMMQIDNANL